MMEIGHLSQVLQAYALQLECILAAKVQYGMWIELASANPLEYS